jgi:hypothetical protein
MNTDCLWRLVPCVVPSRILVGGKVLIGEQAVIDCNGNLVAIFNTEAVATVAVLAHNSAVEGAMEALSRAQLLQHLSDLQKQVTTLKAASRPPVAHPPKAIPVPKPEPRKRGHGRGKAPDVHTLVNGLTATASGRRERSFTPMITNSGEKFWFNRKLKASSSPAPGPENRLAHFDSVSIEKKR